MKLFWPVLFALALALVGCSHDDDGDSSSGGGGSTSGSSGGAPVDFASLAGNYAGSARITISALGADKTETSAVTATINNGGRISITFGDDAVATGQLASDGSFRITDTLANAGIDDCTGTITIAGRASAAAINASISSSGARCSGVPASASGSLSAQRR